MTDYHGRGRVFDWNGHTNREIGMPDVSDQVLASMVRMLMRNDLDHEMIVCAARDRIMCLVKEKARLIQALEEIDGLSPMEINPNNYDDEDVRALNANAIDAGVIAKKALEVERASK
jgi:hypothetical protein